LALASPAPAHQPQIVGKDSIVIKDPEISRAFYDSLIGKPRTYQIESTKEFELYVNILVPRSSNPEGRYSAEVYLIEGSRRKPVGTLKQDSVKWKEFYEPYAGDYYIMGPELKRRVPAGHYEIVVFSGQNRGKYVLAVGEKEEWDLKATVKALVVLPKLKIDFFKTSVLTLLPTLMGLLYLLVLLILIALILAAWRLGRLLH